MYQERALWVYHMVSGRQERYYMNGSRYCKSKNNRENMKNTGSKFTTMVTNPIQGTD